MIAGNPSAADSFIVICTSSGMKTVLVGPDGAPVEEDRNATAPDHCVFGNAIAFGLSDVQPVANGLTSVQRAPAVTLVRIASTPFFFHRVRGPPVPV